MKGATPNTESERGQAYTLEGFVSAMIVLMAVLFALQSVVITPTTGGLADRTVQSQVQQEAQDALVIASGDTVEAGERDPGLNLSEMVRYWDDDDEDEDEEATFYDPDPGEVDGYYNASNESTFYEETALGKTLHDRFAERGMSYNVELVFQNESGEYESVYLVYQGESEAITASYMVTLFDEQELTAPGEDTELQSTDHYPITEAETADGESIYNVVEVRVSVW